MVHLLDPKQETDTKFTVELVTDEGKVSSRWKDTEEPLYNPQNDALSFTDEVGKRVVIFNPGRLVIREA